MRLKQLARFLPVSVLAVMLVLPTALSWGQRPIVIRTGPLTPEGATIPFTPGAGAPTTPQSISSNLTGVIGPIPTSPSANPFRASNINNYINQDEQLNLDANAGNVYVLRTNEKSEMSDYTFATFEVKNVDARELRNVLRTVLTLEAGMVDVIKDKEGKESRIVFYVPEFMVPYLAKAIPLLDEKWVREYDTGSADIKYKAKNRRARDVNIFASQYASEQGAAVVDTTDNAVHVIDEPYRIENWLVGAEAADIPANQVWLEVTVYEIASNEDLKLGLDYINWKNGPGRNLAQFIYEGADAQSRNRGLTSVFDPFAASILPGPFSGVSIQPNDTVKVLTDFDSYYRSVNYLLPSSFVDFLQVNGRARIVSTISKQVKSANTAFIEIEEEIVALVSTPGDVDEFDPEFGIPGHYPTQDITAVRAGIDVHDVGPDPLTRLVRRPGLFPPFRLIRREQPFDPHIHVDDAQDVFIRDYARRLHNTKAGSTGIFLEVTPYVGLESMELDIDLEVRTVNGTSPNGQPIINSRSISTTVRLFDGEPYVIAGLKRRHDIKETAKAPGLGDIPIVGYLFGGETDLKRWDDLVVTVTPHFYVSSQTDLHLTETHRQLIEVVEGGRGVAIPSTPYFYDQWLLDADK